VIADLIFVALALLTVVPAVWVAFSPNIVHAGFSLLFTLLGAAGLYAYLGADFIAVTQVMVYVGGVLVLVLFTVMMTRVPQPRRRRHGLDHYVPAALFAIAVFGLLYKAVTAVQWQSSPGDPQPTTAEIGTNFMTNYIFPFEYVSLVLLAAMIGAAILIREHRNGNGNGNGDEARQAATAEAPDAAAADEPIEEVAS
jgi:NADH-quinone oxidoreductase subunit J